MSAYSSHIYQQRENKHAPAVVYPGAVPGVRLLLYQLGLPPAPHSHSTPPTSSKCTLEDPDQETQLCGLRS
ncbi:hypothetical protein JZ751_008958 [Albula glossodonta]|uniref:Uncharacterized protein n=1 Tax=Albula glossodonta TaxID=121402 RepID=A0A8T2P870_9TELE|nr:hypothetical protein JZ751_008958 [Albula glossodonta]